MTYGVIHYNAPGANLDEFLSWAAGAGFESVELQVRDVWPDETQCGKAATEETKALLKKYNLIASAVSSGNDFVYLDEAEQDKQAERMRKISELALMLDCNVIRTEGGQPKDAVPEDKWVEAMVGCVSKCVPFCKELGVKFAIDNHGWVTNNGDVLLALLSTVNEPTCIGSNLDTMNLRWFGNSLEECDRLYKELAPWVFHTHMKDGTGSRENYRGRDLGNGEINLELAVQCLKEVGYDGAWTAEYEGKEGDGLGYEKCLLWMKHKI